MSTQVSNVLDQDEIDTLRRQLHGNVFSNAANQASETLGDAVTFVTSPVQEVMYDDKIKSFVTGTVFGVALTILIKIVA